MLRFGRRKTKCLMFILINRKVYRESNYITKNGKVIVDGVRSIPLEGSGYTECAYLIGINYSYMEDYVP